MEVGVELALGETLSALPPTPATELVPLTVMTDTGGQITADIWFQRFGVSPVSNYLDEEPIGDVSTADANCAWRARSD